MDLKGIKMNFRFIYKEQYGLSIEMVDTFNLIVAFIEYERFKDTIKIINIERTSYARRKYSIDYHFGTDILNHLIKYIVFDRKKIVNRIIGDLVYPDAHNKNWLDSIPFYIDFPNYLDKSFKMNISFHLYTKEENKELFLPSIRSERKEFIKAMIENCEATHKEYYFEFIIS